MKNSNAAFDIVCADVKGEKSDFRLRVRLKRAARLLLELVRQRRLAVVQFDQKICRSGEESLDPQAGL